jgi:tetratricopeptide (TPR) repeat protein
VNHLSRVLILLTLSLGPLAGAPGRQPEAAVPAPPAMPQPALKALPEVPAQPDREPRQAIAREVARLALLDLRANLSPSVTDFKAALAILGLAHDLDPNNTEIIRRQIEAAHNAGDQDAVLEHTRALLHIDPTDSVAVLRLISSTISRRAQSAEARLAEYEAYLSGDKKSLIDPAVRSRLALDAALLHRERGDDRAFKDKLVQAMQLDSTHKEAAVLAATFFAERVGDDPAGRIDLLVNVLKADPLDPNVHLSIARELVVGGAYVAARRFHSNALNISAIITPPGEAAIVENRVLQWYSRGPALLVKGLNDAVAAQRDGAARAIRRAEAQKKPIANIPKPEDVQLPASVMVLYILAADAAGDAAAATGGIQDFSRFIDKLIEKLRNPRTRGEMSESDATRTALEATIQLNTLRLWTGIEIEKFNQAPEALRGIRQNFPDAANFLDALWALRNDRPQETIDLCTPTETLRMSRIALGMAHEKLGDREKALEYYRAVVKEEPLQPAAVWARQRALTLGADMALAGAKTLEGLVADPRVPAWIDLMAADPGQFLSVRSVLAVQEADATSYTPIRLIITNQSAIPLALGPDRPISSRFLLAPKVELQGLEPLIRPEVIDIDRRLRLLPRESFEVEVWPSPGQSGWVTDALANRSIRLRWKFIQGFIADSRGTYHPGPMCLDSETEALLIRPLAASSLSPPELARTILTSPLENLRRLACITRAQVLQPHILPDPVPQPPADAKQRIAPPPVPPPPPDFKPIATAFTSRYAALPPATRAMIAAIVPHARLCPDMAGLDAVVRADQDPLVRCIALSTRVIDTGDETLTAAKTSDDPRVRTVAEAVAARLAPGTHFYALLTPADLRPPVNGAAPGGGGGEGPK